MCIPPQEDEADDLVLQAVGSARTVLLTGTSGSGKSSRCEAVLRRLGAHVVRWDPTSTGMQFPSLVERHFQSPDRPTVVYADDVDVAICTCKGGGSALIAALRRVPPGVALLLTAGPIAGDRVLCALAKAVDLHVHLRPTRAEVVTCLMAGCAARSIRSVEAAADRFGGDIRGASLALDNLTLADDGDDDDGDCDDEGTRLGLPDGTACVQRVRAALDVALLKWTGEDTPEGGGLTSVAFAMDRIAAGLAWPPQKIRVALL